MLRAPRKVTLQHHQMLRLPQKVTRTITKCCPWHNSDIPTSPNVAPATKSDTCHGCKECLIIFHGETDVCKLHGPRSVFRKRQALISDKQFYFISLMNQICVGPWFRNVSGSKRYMCRVFFPSITFACWKYFIYLNSECGTLNSDQIAVKIRLFRPNSKMNGPWVKICAWLMTILVLVAWIVFSIFGLQSTENSGAHLGRNREHDIVLSDGRHVPFQFKFQVCNSWRIKDFNYWMGCWSVCFWARKLFCRKGLWWMVLNL